MVADNPTQHRQYAFDLSISHAAARRLQVLGISTSGVRVVRVVRNRRRACKLRKRDENIRWSVGHGAWVWDMRGMLGHKRS